MAGSRTDATRRQGGRRWPLRVALAVGVAVVLLAGAVAARAATESGPQLHSFRVLASQVTFPGTAAALAWPSEGEAAIEVAGVGPVGSAGGDRPVPIASVAKVMTAYVVLRDHPLAATGGGFQIRISPADVADQQARAAQGESTVAVAPGEILDERQLLEALLIPSGNNIAVLLARADAGSVAAFVSKMNATAVSLGLHHTTYTDPSGYLPTTVSTAADQLTLAEHALAVPALASIVRMPSATLPVAGTVRNTDQLVGKDGFIGIKTGSESAAGGCLAFASQRTVGGHQVTAIGVVLGQKRGQTDPGVLISAALGAARALADSVTAQLAVRPVVSAGTPVVEVANADGHHVKVVAAHDIRQLGWAGLPVTVRVEGVPLGSRLVSGQRAATVIARTGRGPAGRTAAVATSTMPGPSVGWRLSHLF